MWLCDLLRPAVLLAHALNQTSPCDESSGVTFAGRTLGTEDSPDWGRPSFLPDVWGEVVFLEHLCATSLLGDEGRHKVILVDDHQRCSIEETIEACFDAACTGVLSSFLVLLFLVNLATLQSRTGTHVRGACEVPLVSL